MLRALTALSLLVALPTVASAAQTPAVSTANASPAAFIPNWDGHTDATVVSYTLVERSLVLVRVVDNRGRLVRNVESGIRPAGTHLASWDGRDGDGLVRPAGVYRVRVTAQPRPAAPSGVAGQPGEASLGGVVVAGEQGATITLQRSPVVIGGVRLSRAALGRSGAASSTSARFDLSSAASVSAAIVNSRGTALRTLAVGRMRAGAHTLAWNGKRSDGRSLPDGSYALVVAASGAGRPTATTRLPLQVDRRVPVLRASKRVGAVAASTGMRVPLVAVVSEPTTLTVRAGRRSQRFALKAAGSHRLSVDAGRLGIVSGRRARSLVLRVVAVDAAGNVSSSPMTVVVPPLTRGTTVRPPAGPKPAPNGKMQWPIAGTMTSGFGMRWGRPHTGIDISAPTGTPIHPAGPGTVAFVGVYGGYGNLVMVDHPGGVRTYYAHMSAFGGFAVGAKVDPLDVIGLVGCTGSCTGAHIHFETRVGSPPNDVPRDPLGFLAAR